MTRKKDIKLDMGQDVYYVFGDCKKYGVVVKAQVNSISVFESGISYHLSEGTVIHCSEKAKLKKGDKISPQVVNQNNLNTDSYRPIFGWAFFDTIQNVKRYVHNAR